MLKGGGFKALVKQGGAKNLYAGVWGNLAGVAPASAVFMAIYEPIKAALNERVPENRSFLAPLGAGSAAGLAASVIRVPTEVVKQRLQSGKHAMLTDRPLTLVLDVSEQDTDALRTHALYGANACSQAANVTPYHTRASRCCAVPRPGCPTSRRSFCPSPHLLTSSPPHLHHLSLTGRHSHLHRR